MQISQMKLLHSLYPALTMICLFVYNWIFSLFQGVHICIHAFLCSIYIIYIASMYRHWCVLGVGLFFFFFPISLFHIQLGHFSLKACSVCLQPWKSHSDSQFLHCLLLELLLFSYLTSSTNFLFIVIASVYSTALSFHSTVNFCPGPCMKFSFQQ